MVYYPHRRLANQQRLTTIMTKVTTADNVTSVANEHTVNDSVLHKHTRLKTATQTSASSHNFDSRNTSESRSWTLQTDRQFTTAVLVMLPTNHMRVYTTHYRYYEYVAIGGHITCYTLSNIHLSNANHSTFKLSEEAVTGRATLRSNDHNSKSLRQKCKKRFGTYLYKTCINSCKNKTRMTTDPYCIRHISSNTMQQGKCVLFEIIGRQY